MDKEKDNNETGKIIVAEEEWDFLKIEKPKFLIETLKEIVKFLGGLPFLNEEDVKEISEKIKRLREKFGIKDNS